MIMSRNACASPGFAIPVSAPVPAFDGFGEQRAILTKRSSAVMRLPWLIFSTYSRASSSHFDVDPVVCTICSPRIFSSGGNPSAPIRSIDCDFPCVTFSNPSVCHCEPRRDEAISMLVVRFASSHNALLAMTFPVSISSRLAQRASRAIPCLRRA